MILTKAIFTIFWFLVKWSFFGMLCMTPLVWVLIPYVIISWFYKPSKDKEGLPDQELRGFGQIGSAFKSNGGGL